MVCQHVTGNAFKDNRFVGRKLYPCVGFDTSEKGIGLHFEINFLSPDGSFMYKGPYE
jgi:hypothetical protein